MEKRVFLRDRDGDGFEFCRRGRGVAFERAMMEGGARAGTGKESRHAARGAPTHDFTGPKIKRGPITQETEIEQPTHHPGKEEGGVPAVLRLRRMAMRLTPATRTAAVLAASAAPDLAGGRKRKSGKKSVSCFAYGRPVQRSRWSRGMLCQTLDKTAGAAT